MHPLPVDLNLAEILPALKNFSADPGEAAHAAWHGAGYFIGLWHKHAAGFAAAAASNSRAAALADELAAGLESMSAGGDDLKAIDWNTIKPWLKKFLEFLVMILG